jgi:hypothetical protein
LKNSLNRFYHWLLAIQGGYYFITAAWGLIDIDSFMDVSGPKTDIWLVKTVSAMLLAICAGIFTAILQREINLAVAVMCFALTISFAAIDFYYTLNKTIKWVYAVDGGLQIVFMIGWMLVFLKKRKSW